MELKFEKTSLSSLETGLQEVRNLEQTQELRLPEGMPDIGRVLGAWGQAVMRSKEWRQSEVGMTAGMMVWVLYESEDGSGMKCLESWIPFQLRWELPQELPEGAIRIRCLPRFVDARSASARKLILRAGLAAQAQALSPKETAVYRCPDMPQGVELLQNRYPLRLPREAGEKAFALDEELSLPDSAPQPEKIVYCTLQPEITEQKVLANKVVFRGNANAHMLYLSEEGQLHGWEFPMPFHQFADLGMAHSGEAQADTALCVTNLEPELDEEGKLRLKCGLVGQYLIDDVEMVEVAEDAYSPGRELSLEREWLELPVLLENRRETLRSEQTLPVDANLAADIRFLPDFPRQRRTENGITMTVPGMYQVLYYGENGGLQPATARWEGELSLRAGEDSRVDAVPGNPTEPQMTLGSGTMTVKSDLPMEVTTSGTTRIPMVTGLTVGSQSPKDPARPSIILRRTGKDSLWSLAKKTGSTTAAIQKANNLEGEPGETQMLLIPVS